MTAERLDLLREDVIACAELTEPTWIAKIWQFPVVLLAEVRLVGVQGLSPHLLAPGGAASGDLRGRHDRRLGTLPYDVLERRSRRGSPTRSAR